MRKTDPWIRFWDKVHVTPGCWEWTAYTNKKQEYGRLNIGGRVVYAHKWYWEQVNGPVPDGLELSHTCDNPKCVNLQHLVTETHLDNVRRQKRVSGPVCGKGHERISANTNKAGQCKLCRRENWAKMTIVREV